MQELLALFHSITQLNMLGTLQFGSLDFEHLKKCICM